MIANGIEILQGDCIEVMASLEAESFDAVITDPPYAFAGGFMGKSWDAFDAHEDAGFAYWLSGLIDGEGCFLIKAHTRGTHAPMFFLKMRADERGILERIQRSLDIGQIDDVDQDPNPMARWTVQDKQGCQRLVDFLDKYPLRAKKRIDFLTWREAVCEWTDRPRGNRWHGPADNSRMAHLRAKLMANRKYQEIAWSGNEFQDWTRLWAWECFRILKPGGHLAAFASPRQSHRLTSGIEDAGFEIRDSISWEFGQGYPKSIDGEREVARATCELPGRHCLTNLPPEERRKPDDHICPETEFSRRFKGIGSALKPAHEPIIIARKPIGQTIGAGLVAFGTGGLHVDAARIGMSAEDMERIRRMSGFGRAAYQCQVGVSLCGSADGSLNRKTDDAEAHASGRWPSNVVLSHRPECSPAGERAVRTRAAGTSEVGSTSDVYGTYGDRSAVSHGDADGLETVEAWLCVEGCPVLELDRQSGEAASGGTVPKRYPDAGGRSTFGTFNGGDVGPVKVEPSTGGASRYFPVFAWLPEDLAAAAELEALPLPAFRYEAKATRDERDLGCDDLAQRSAGETVERREGSHGLNNARAGAGRTSGARNHHPTVKPLGLMRWLVRLLTKPGDSVVDPFLGSGTTAMACRIEGVRCLGIEREPDFVEIAARRVEAVEQPAMLALAEAEPEPEPKGGPNDAQRSLFE